MSFTSWWENKGVAPCYRPWRLAFRLNGSQGKYILPADADLRLWLPGDNLYDSAVVVPAEAATGQYDFQIAVLDEEIDEPWVKLAIEGRQADGWYNLGKISVER